MLTIVYRLLTFIIIVLYIGPKNLEIEQGNWRLQGFSSPALFNLSFLSQWFLTRSSCKICRP